jgi:hypothetical protein
MSLIFQIYWHLLTIDMDDSKSFNNTILEFAAYKVYEGMLQFLELPASSFFFRMKFSFQIRIIDSFYCLYSFVTDLL